MRNNSFKERLEDCFHVLDMLHKEVSPTQEDVKALKNAKKTLKLNPDDKQIIALILEISGIINLAYRKQNEEKESADREI